MLDALHSIANGLSFGNQLLFTPNGPTYNPTTSIEKHYKGGRIICIPCPTPAKINSSESSMPRPIPCVFVPPPPQSPAGGDALLVVHFHGKGGDAWTSGGVWFDAAQRASSQHNLPVAVLSVEYPGYGIFPGRSSEEVWKFTGDAVMSYLLNSLRIPPQRIIVSGRSMGAGVATHVASTRTTISPVSTAYLGLVLISPFTSIHGALQSFPLGTTFLPRMLKDRFDNIAAIRNVPSQTQLLVVHGAKDTLIYPSQGMEICKSATHLHETFVLDPEADHHNMPGLVSALEAFVTNVRGNAQMLRTTNCDSWVTQLQSLAISPDRVEELNAAELAEQRKLRRLREVAIGSSVAWSIALPTLPSRLLLVCWSAMLFGLGLIHKQKTEKNARGEWNNKVFGVLSTSTRYAIVTVACRLVFPIMLARRGCVMSAIAISYITHLFLR